MGAIGGHGQLLALATKLFDDGLQRTMSRETRASGAWKTYCESLGIDSVLDQRHAERELRAVELGILQARSVDEVALTWA